MALTGLLASSGPIILLVRDCYAKLSSNRELLTSVDVDGYDVGPNAGCGSTAASVVERELDVGAHADWKDELDIGAHVEWNNKAGAESEA